MTQNFIIRLSSLKRLGLKKRCHRLFYHFLNAERWKIHDEWHEVPFFFNGYHLQTKQLEKQRGIFGAPGNFLLRNTTLACRNKIFGEMTTRSDIVFFNYPGSLAEKFHLIL